MGEIQGTDQAFYSRRNDTTLLNPHVYDARIVGLNTPNLARPHIHANGEVSHAWSAGSNQTAL